VKSIESVDITPEEFEEQAKSWLDRVENGLESFRVTHREDLEGRAGEYEIDAVAHLQVLGGAEIEVLVECKRHKNPIKRDVVMLLNQKLQETGSHKGIIFCTSRFQSGAVEFAEEHGIALVIVQEGEANYETKALRQSSPDAFSWVPKSDYVGWVTRLNEKGNESRSKISDNRIAPLENWFSE
jgi:restriction system protein